MSRNEDQTHRELINRKWRDHGRYQSWWWRARLSAAALTNGRHLMASMFRQGTGSAGFNALSGLPLRPKPLIQETKAGLLAP